MKVNAQMIIANSDSFYVKAIFYYDTSNNSKFLIPYPTALSLTIPILQE